MNPELQKQLLDYLQQLSTAIKAGSDFVITQAPLMVQEKIIYGRIVETSWFVVGLLLAIGAAIVAYRSLGPWTEELDQYNDTARLIRGGIGFWGGVAVLAIATISTLSSIPQVAQVWFAPRLYILEWIMGMARK